MISEGFGTITSDQLRSFLGRKGLLGDRQCGFRLRRCADNRLAVISHSWSAVLDNQGETHLVSLDIFQGIWFSLASRSVAEKVLIRLSSGFCRGCHVTSASGSSPSESMLVFPKVPYLRSPFFLLLINGLINLHFSLLFFTGTTLHCSLSYWNVVGKHCVQCRVHIINCRIG